MGRRGGAFGSHSLGRGFGGHSHHFGSGMAQGYAMVPPFFANGCITYNGTLPQLVLQFNNLTPDEKLQVKQLNLAIDGDTIQEVAMCCLCLNLMLGCFIFPLFVMCCQCTREVISAAADVSVEAYATLDGIIGQCPNVGIVSILVNDSFLDANKAALLERNLMKMPKVINFGFTNCAFPRDIEFK